MLKLTKSKKCRLQLKMTWL